MTDQKIRGIVTGFQNGAGVMDTATQIYHPYNQIRVQTDSGILTTWVKSEDTPEIGAEVSGSVVKIDTLKDTQQELPSQSLLILTA